VSHPPPLHLRAAPVAPKPASVKGFAGFYQIGGPPGKWKSGFNYPFGLAFDPGDLLVAANLAGTVTVYSPPLVSGDPFPASTITITTPTSPSYPAGITNVQLGGQQLTFVADYSGSITVYDSGGNLLTTLSGGNTGLKGPVRVVVIPSP